MGTLTLVFARLLLFTTQHAGGSICNQVHLQTVTSAYSTSCLFEVEYVSGDAGSARGQDASWAAAAAARQARQPSGVLRPAHIAHQALVMVMAIGLDDVLSSTILIHSQGLAKRRNPTPHLHL